MSEGEDGSHRGMPDFHSDSSLAWGLGPRDIQAGAELRLRPRPEGLRAHIVKAAWPGFTNPEY